MGWKIWVDVFWFVQAKEEVLDFVTHHKEKLAEIWEKAKMLSGLRGCTITIEVASEYVRSLGGDRDEYLELYVAISRDGVLSCFVDDVVYDQTANIGREERICLAQLRIEETETSAIEIVEANR
ncbi:MAG: hypothetical protein DRO09_00430 [Thermoprotei archaeon]|nr:MAG: hypothetical protein DRO09_00430 [Thermoprotei archaeon]